MLKTALKRVLQCIPTLFIVVTFTFILTRAIPGNPARTILGPQASAAEIEAMEIKLGLDLPKWQQYLNYMGDVLQGDFGTSYMYNQPVVELILQRIPGTLQITITALIIALIVGVVAGIVVAFVLKKQLKSVRQQKQANVYIKSGSMQITTRRDLFLYREVSRTKKDTSKSSGSGSSRSVGGGKF